MSAPSVDDAAERAVDPGSPPPPLHVQYIRQPRRIAGSGSVARGIAVQRQCARRHPAKAKPVHACCPAGSHVRPGGEPVVESQVRDGRGMLHGSGPARRGGASAAAWRVADALSVAGVAAGAAWAPRIDSAARSLQPARVRHHPADVVAFAEVAAAWLAKARAPCWPSGTAVGGRAAPVELDNRRQASRARYPPPSPSPTRPSPAGDGVRWGAVDHLSDVDMVHKPAEMSMETAGPEPRRAAARQQATAWRFRAFAERRMTELVRSGDDARTEAFYAGHARHRRTDADLFAALLVGTADTVVALMEDGLTESLPERRADYLLRHVAAGPSGMRNEYLRCLLGEYAPASGHAAVRAMSEVTSMYLQGRLPGCFNRLFASARLVAPVKKLGESGAPDVRLVAVGEAEWRAAERAVVDNMKEAYVWVLEPSQLGAGISATDSMLIHSVRLIAVKLGTRAAIVHTHLRNAYNEAWRRTIIQRHIDCSPLHPIIPALLASLSTDSYLVVDDRSAPLRSEDGAQQGAPLTTTSFCVAIHPEVQQCHSTLEVTDGAARFNADDGYLAGLPELVWPALHAFRTFIKASVGLDCLSMPVLNVPVGSPEYMHAYMRGKAEELRVEAGYLLRNCLPSEVEAFAEAVDVTVLAAVERVLGVRFDPSTSGIDTNPVGWSPSNFLAEILHDPDPMAVEATLSEDAVARARSMLHLPTRLKGAGIRRMATFRDAACIGCMNEILPSYAAAMREAWGRLQVATDAGHLSDADARVMEREAEAASGSQKELTAFLDHADNSWLRNEVCAIPVTCRERILFNQLDAASGMWTVAIPAHGADDAFRDHCVHDLRIAVRREVDDLFQKAVPYGNTVPGDELKDLVPDAELSLPVFNVVTGSYDPRSLKSTLLEFKTMGYGVKYTAVPRATAVDRFERSM
eukprot:jgi/Tetstr1/429862/TSEL_019727.t2